MSDSLSNRLRYRASAFMDAPLGKLMIEAAEFIEANMAMETNKPVINLKINNPNYMKYLNCIFNDDSGSVEICKLPDFISDISQNKIICPVEIKEDEKTEGLYLWKVPLDCPLRKNDFHIELGELDKRYD